MKRALIILFLVLASNSFAQIRSKDYKLHPSLKVSSIFSTDTVLLFKFHSLSAFDIKPNDKMILITSMDTISLICDKPTSFHIQHTASGTYYNGAYFKVSKEQYDVLLKSEIEDVKINDLQYAIKNKTGIQKALNK